MEEEAKYSFTGSDDTRGPRIRAVINVVIISWGKSLTIRALKKGRVSFFLSALPAIRYPPYTKKRQTAKLPRPICPFEKFVRMSALSAPMLMGKA